MQVKCQNCGQTVPDGNFCDQCGAPIIKKQNVVSPPPKITLVQVKGGNIKLDLMPDTVLGRKEGPYADKLKNFTFISGKHAYISYSTPRGWEVTDLGSTNGTYVNDDRLVKDSPHVFGKGDIIDFGTMIFEVV